ncbi:hypothetical protein NQ318_013978 [Aromia moschata]|uniref:Trichohyalin-plectin-homology domain-containing protein n=1 Tax=Aromia moschata TaxID=1265417 RepID=A0AAV8YY90_9CUCU|nr:hypothetical protein NQ318_013978 [Aromia moschata]
MRKVVGGRDRSSSRFPKAIPTTVTTILSMLNANRVGLVFFFLISEKWRRDFTYFPARRWQIRELRIEVKRYTSPAKEWHRISKHLERKKDIQEALEIEESKRKYLEEGSKNMIKNWDNSLENIRKRKEEARFRRLEGIKEDRMRRFFQMREEQAEIRKQYVEKVKKQMFMETGWARDINSGYVLSESHEGEVEMEYAKVVKVNAEKEVEEKAEEVRRLHEGRKEYGEYLRNVSSNHPLKYVSKKNYRTSKKVKETQMMKEALDNIMAVKEMEFLKKKQEEQKLLEKMEMKKDKEKYLKSVEEFKNQIIQEEKEVDDVLAIYQESQTRNRLLEETKRGRVLIQKFEKNIFSIMYRRYIIFIFKQAAIIARRELIAKMVMAEETARAETEENCLESCYSRTRCQDEDDKRRLSEKEMDDCLSKISFAGVDAKFFEYADEVMELAKKKGRSTYPIEMVILEYKKFNRLLPEGKKCTACEHIRSGRQEKSVERSSKQVI